MPSKSGNPRTGNPEVSEADLAWLAGIMDGEGSIATYWTKLKSGGRVPHLKISVANTDWLMIERVRTLFHAITGRHYKACEKWQAGQIKRQWQIFCNRKASISALCKALFPYLVTRRRAAWAAIEWCRVERARGYYPNRLFAYTEMIRNTVQYPTRPGDGNQFETVETGRWQLFKCEKS